MSDPVRKPTSEPPDVDSLMSRLDGERPSDPGGGAGPSSVDGDGRPSAAELLGGRGRRRRTALRVPDDAVPGSAPKAPRARSVPPPSGTSSPNLVAAVAAPVVAPIPAAPAPRSERPSAPPPAKVVEPPPAFEAPSAGAIPPPPFELEAAPVGMTLPQAVASAPEVPAPRPPSQPPPEELLERASFVAEPPVATLAANTSPVAPVVVMQQRIISIGGPATAPPPRIDPVIAPPPEAFAVLGPDTSLDASLEVGASRPIDATSGTHAVVRSEAPVTDLPVTPPAAPGPLRAPTMPNLDATVREALAMLDTSDFDASIDVPVDVEEPAASPDVPEESLDDQVVEEVQAKKPPPRKKAQSEPAPATGDEPPATLPAATAVSAPTSTAATTPSPGATANGGPTSGASPAASPAASTAASSAASSSATQPAPSAPVMTTPEAPEKRKKRQWFEELFNDDFARTMPRMRSSYLEREARFIEDALGCEKGATILDLGCGAGEQAVALAGRGYEVIGIDLSLAMLARAADEAADKQQRINFLQGDMRELSFEAAFDGVYCWGMTFGYFDDAKNAEVVAKVHRALRPGGRFLLDISNRDFLACRLPSMVWFEGDGCVCMDEVQLNSITSRLQVKRTLMMEDGRQRELEYTIRLYALHELGKLLHDHGFRVVEASGDTATPGVFFGADSPRILILAEKK